MRHFDRFSNTVHLWNDHLHLICFWKPRKFQARFLGFASWWSPISQWWMLWELRPPWSLKSKLENKQSLFRRTLGRGFPTLEMGVGRSLDLSTGNGTAYKSSFMQSVLPQIPRCDMVLLHCSQGSMQIDRFPCKFDSYSIGINFGLPKVKESGEQAEEPKSGDLRQMKIKRPALELRISAFSYLTH